MAAKAKVQYGLSHVVCFVKIKEMRISSWFCVVGVVGVVGVAGVAVGVVGGVGGARCE
jgi:hypothetical protein